MMEYLLEFIQNYPLMFALIALGIVVLLILFTIILGLFRGMKNMDSDYRDLNNQFSQSQRQYRETQNQYEQYRSGVEAEVLKEKEVEKRRRVTPTLKKTVLERDNYTCQICGISKGYIDHYIPGLGDYLRLEVDHIKSVKSGGSGDSADNLQTLCWRCNAKKSGDRTNAETARIITWGIRMLKPNAEAFNEQNKQM